MATNRQIISPEQIGKLKPQNSGQLWAYIGKNQVDLARLERSLPKENKIELGKYLSNISQKLGPKYVEYIAKLPIPEDKLLWYSNRLSEKNPFLSETFLHICQAKLCENLLTENERILLIVENDSVRELVEKGHSKKRISRRVKIAISETALFIKKRASFIVKYLFRYFVSHFLRKKKPLGKRVWIHSFLNPKSIDSEGKYHDAYFGDLKKFIKKKGEDVTILAQIPNIRDYFKLTGMLDNCKENLIVPDRYIGFLDIFSVFLRSLKSIRIEDPPQFEGFDMRRILYEELRREWLEGWCCVSLLYEPIFRNMKKDGEKIDRLIYTFEGTSWEKIFCHSAKKYFPNARIIGYQHAAVSSMQLNHFIAPEEVGKTPLPDVIITSGEYMHEKLISAGYPREMIIQGGTIRFAYLYDKKSNNRTTFKRVLITTSINKIEAVELIRKCILGLGGNFDYDVVIKCHPHMRYSLVKDDVGLALPNNFKISEEPVSELFEGSDFLVYTDSTTALEAIFLGVFPIHLEIELGLDMDKLDFDTSTRESFGTPKELAEVMAQIKNKAPDEIRKIRTERQKKITKLLGKATEQTYRIFLN